MSSRQLRTVQTTVTVYDHGVDRTPPSDSGELEMEHSRRMRECKQTRFANEANW